MRVSSCSSDKSIDDIIATSSCNALSNYTADKSSSMTIAHSEIISPHHKTERVK